MIIKERLQALKRQSLTPDGAGFTKYKLARFMDVETREVDQLVRKGVLPKPERTKMGESWSGKALRDHWEGKLKAVHDSHTPKAAKHRERTANGGQLTMLSTEAERSDYAAANTHRKPRRRKAG